MCESLYRLGRCSPVGASAAVWVLRWRWTTDCGVFLGGRTAVPVNMTALYRKQKPLAALLVDLFVLELTLICKLC